MKAVYIINGFLESGKTEFIQFTMQQPYFQSKEKEQSNAAMFGVMADVIKDPSKLQGILELANNPAFKKK